MIKSSFLYALFLMCGIIISTLTSVGFSQPLQIEQMLPLKGEVGDWSPDGEPQYVVGEDLFQVINGGAEIYHEYGFKKAAYQTYISSTGRLMNLEIYEMVSPAAAYGIYTFKTGETGTAVDMGDETWLESYYLNMWKGNFVITIIGLDTEKILVDDLIKLAQVIDSKFLEKSERPELTTYLPKEKLKQNGIIYLKGNLSLFNQYCYDTKNIFGLEEGIIGNYEDYSIYIFQYINHQEMKKWYQSAKEQIKNSDRFHNFIEYESQFNVDDDLNNYIVIKSYKKWILIILGKNLPDVSPIFLSLEDNLNHKRPY